MSKTIERRLTIRFRSVSWINECGGHKDYEPIYFHCAIFTMKSSPIERISNFRFLKCLCHLIMDHTRTQQKRRSYVASHTPGRS